MTDGFARRRLLGILSGSWVAQSCYVLAKLGVPDLLADGPRTARELAVKCGADPRTLHRLLRTMVSIGLIRQVAPDMFALTSVTELLRSDVPHSLRDTAVMHGEEVYRSFAEIVHTVRTGEPAFERVYGKPFYGYLADNPRAAATFAASMGAAGVPAALATCELDDVGTLVDVGGGDGGLLADVLAAHPAMRGVLLELPEAVGAARSTLDAAGLADRVELVEGSFFDSVPAGGDAYVLARVLHNWSDEHATAILHRVRAAMGERGRLIVFEELLPDEGDRQGAAGMVDLLMLVTLEGRDRTEAEYRALLAGAGFDIRAARRGPGRAGEGVLEAVPS